MIIKNKLVGIVTFLEEMCDQMGLPAILIRATAFKSFVNHGIHLDYLKHKCEY